MSELRKVEGDQTNDSAMAWLAIVTAIVVLALIVGLVLLFKFNLFEGGAGPNTPST